MKRKWSYVVKALATSPFFLVSAAIVFILLLLTDTFVALIITIIFLAMFYAQVEEVGQQYEEKVAQEIRLTSWRNDAPVSHRNCGDE